MYPDGGGGGQVNIVLESAQVDYRPTMINLTHVINIVTKELMGTIKAVSRVREALGDSPNANAAAAAAPSKKLDATSTTGEPVGAPPVAKGEGEGEGEGSAGTTGQSAGEGAAGEGAAGEGGSGAGGLLPVAQVRVGRRLEMEVLGRGIIVPFSSLVG